MKNSYLRITSILLSFSIALSLLGSCKSKKEDDESLLLNNMAVSKDSNLNLNGLPIVKEKINLTGVSIKTQYQMNWNALSVLNEYENMTNININWNSMLPEMYSNSMKLAIEKGELPDLFMATSFSQSDELAAGEKGIIIPLNDLLKKNASAFMSIVAKNPDVLKTITNIDGKIYTLPELNDVMETRACKTWINKKWLDNLGLKVPTTTDEFYNTLKAFKEKDPNKNGLQDEIPISGAYVGGWSDDLILYFMGYWGFLDRRITNYVDVDKNGKVRFIADDPKYKEELMYLNKLWSEGLIDKDFRNVGYTQFQKKMDSGIVGYTPGSVDYDWLGKTKNDFICLPVLKGPYGDHVLSRAFSVVQANGTFAISKSNKYPEATMRWADYLYTTEGTKLFKMGIEGKTYNKLPDGSLAYIDALTKYSGVNGLEQAMARYTPGFGSFIPMYLTRENDKTFPPITIEQTKALIPDMPKEFIRPMYTEEQLSDIKSQCSGLITYINEMSLKFMFGEEPFSNWDLYASKLKEMGSEKYLEIHEEVYKRWKGN